MSDPIKWAAENVDRAPAYSSGSLAYLERPLDGYTVPEVYWALVRAGVEGLPEPSDRTTPDGVRRLFEMARTYQESGAS